MLSAGRKKEENIFKIKNLEETYYLMNEKKLNMKGLTSKKRNVEEISPQNQNPKIIKHK